jgi:ankyrin repeat protein
VTGKHPKRKERVGVDRAGLTLLHHAAANPDVSIAKRLIAAKLNPNAQDDNGWTPLHFAAQARSAEVASVLLESGANPNLRDAHGNGPLATALMNAREDTTVFELLIKAGADPLQKNRYGRSVLDTVRILENGEAFEEICRTAPTLPNKNGT